MLNNKLFLFLITLLLLSSCAKLDKLTLTVKKADYDKCEYTFKGDGNTFKVKGDFYFYEGDKFKLRPTESNDGVIFNVSAYSPSERSTTYFLRRGNSRITFVDTTIWGFSTKFKLSKIQ